MPKPWKKLLYFGVYFAISYGRLCSTIYVQKVHSLGDPCEYDEECEPKPLASCIKGYCKCTNGTVAVAKICGIPGGPGDKCFSSLQCILHECDLANCYCDYSRCTIDVNSTTKPNLNNVIIIVAICITITCVLIIGTVYYRRYIDKIIYQNSTNSLRSPNISILSRSVSTNVHIQVPEDLPPPLYDEVVSDTSKFDPDLPTYNEFLEIQRLSLQNGSLEMNLQSANQSPSLTSPCRSGSSDSEDIPMQAMLQDVDDRQHGVASQRPTELNRCADVSIPTELQYDHTGLQQAKLQDVNDLPSQDESNSGNSLCLQADSVQDPDVSIQPKLQGDNSEANEVSQPLQHSVNKNNLWVISQGEDNPLYQEELQSVNDSLTNDLPSQTRSCSDNDMIQHRSSCTANVPYRVGAYGTNDNAAFEGD